MKKQIMIVIILLLVSTNITTLALINRPSTKEQQVQPMNRRQSQQAVVQEIITQLGFSREQHDQHRALNQSTSRKKRELMARISQKQQELLTHFASDSSNTAVMEELAEEIGTTYEEFNKVSIDHHQALMELCTDEQRVILQEIYKDMIE